MQTSSIKSKNQTDGQKSKTRNAGLLLFLKPYMGGLAVSACFAAISVFASLVLPVFVGKAVDCLIGAGKVDFVDLRIILVKMLIILAFGGIAQLVAGRINIKISAMAVRRLRGEAFDAVTRLPLSSVDAHSHGDLESRIIADADAVGDGLLLGFSQLFTGVLTILGTIGFLFYISPHIAPVVVLLTPMSLLVARFISDRSRKYFLEQAALRGELTAFCEEQIGGVKLLRCFGANERSKRDFAGFNERLNEISLKATFYSSLPNPSSRFVNNTIYMAVGVIGALYAIAGGITVGGLTSFLSYASGYAKPFNEITGVITEFQNAFVCAGRLFELIGAKPEQETGEGELLSVRGDIAFENVAFSYDKKVPLITDFSLAVKRGAHIAVVGPTGAGKTTLVNLLMRFYDVDSGTISVDGTDIADITRKSLRSSFGMVLQETWLREGTVFSNLTLGKADATIGEVVEAAKLTRAHDFIRRLPQGYDTPLSSDGGTLSQGEKQLLCITRIMLSLPPMLILDEATSSIDTRTEQKIQTAFHRMMQNRTTFIVAHRLSTIRNSDLILYMEHGNVLEQGTHEALLAKDGRYAALYRRSLG
ncbi:MAG: ABC transporter ATP-binding protein [Lachnospiraceae bacterium]|nr:ABC transporter ATP-binding protein [Lachnospiraceae bacterium]